jgi:hypothetical protein
MIRKKKRVKRKKIYYTYKGNRCSKGEYRIATILEKLNIPFTREQTFSTCKSPKNNPLRFDFFIKQYGLLIEFQGHHHYKPISKRKKDIATHKRTVIHDQIKEAFVRRHKYNYAKIPYKYIDRLDSIIKSLVRNMEEKNKEDVYIYDEANKETDNNSDK